MRKNVSDSESPRTKTVLHCHYITEPLFGRQPGQPLLSTVTFPLTAKSKADKKKENVLGTPLVLRWDGEVCPNLEFKGAAKSSAPAHRLTASVSTPAVPPF